MGPDVHCKHVMLVLFALTRARGGIKTVGMGPDVHCKHVMLVLFALTRARDGIKTVGMGPDVHCKHVMLVLFALTRARDGIKTVGMGPDVHCKHVVLVLFALTTTRDGIKTAETCTQQLQTFHQVKKYNGSPVKTQDLKLRRDGSLSHLLSFDPRPVEYRNLPEYPQQFQSVWITSRTLDIPIWQLYEPTDTQPVHHDYDYLKETSEECFLHHVNITTMTEEQQDQLEFR